MNLITARALLEDARQQVLDNTVFRLLVILSGIPILFTFLVGFHEEEISLLWGLKTIEYSTFHEMGFPRDYGAEHLIQALQSLVVNFFAGSIGVIFCIAATAFFAPRILEKGAADTLFAKPVSRMVILLSRYFAGVLFIGLVAVVLVVGMYLGFLVTSGYNDPGFLWGVLTLMYLFSLVHAFSICIAVLTRSSTAAILLTLVLFMFSGAIHGGWVAVTFFRQQEAVEVMRAADADEEEDEDEGPSTIVRVLLGTLDTAHYILPKTSDADIITDKLRRAITEDPPQIETADGEFVVKRPPADFTMVEATEDELEGEGVRWVAETESGEADGWVRVRRYERPTVEEERGGRQRIRQKTSRTISKEWVAELEAREDLEEEPESESQSLGGMHMLSVTWKSEGRLHERVFFHFGDWLYELDLDVAAAFKTEEDLAGWRRDFLHGRGNIVLGSITGMDPATWYTKTFSWTAPWKFNIFFSIGSSVAFALAMLFIAWLKLRKIDF